MDNPTIFWKIREWLAFKVVLPIFYAIFGSKPVFCEYATHDDCKLELSWIMAQLKDERLAYTRAMWALITAAGGEIRISKIILHDATLANSVISTYEDFKTGDYVYNTNPRKGQSK